jgi:glucokinase
VISVGLDVGGTKVLGVAVDPRAPTTVIAEDRVPTPDGGDGLVEVLLDLVRSLDPAPAAIGVGVPGLVDREGTLHMGPHLRRMQDVPLARLLGERAGIPALVDNDANCHALAEHVAGAAAGADEALVVTLGTGIGAGIISAGRVLHGAHGFAGEPGHMVVDPNGPPCPCGKRGCWERFASGTGLGRLARDAASGRRLDAAVALAGGDPEAVRGEHVTASARAGDRESKAVLDAFAHWIALGLANLVNVLDPAVIVIGGGLVEAADLLLPEVRKRFAQLVMAGERRPVVPIVPAELGYRAGAIGAALAADPARAASPG